MGRPYRPGAAGPDAYDCFGLACHLMAALHGLTVPRDGAGFIRARRLFRPVSVPDRDALGVMGQGDRHVGVWLAAERVLIHAVERRGVVVDDLHALQMSGFGRPRWFAPR